SPLQKYEAGRDAEAPAPAARGLRLESRAALAPGRRDDRSLDEIAEHAVVARRLVVLVEQAAGDEEQAEVGLPVASEVTLDIGLLHFDLARIFGRGHRVLDLDFTHQARSLIEPVLEADDEARQVEGGLRRIVTGPAVVQFTVAEPGQRRARVGGRYYRSGSGSGRWSCRSRSGGRWGCSSRGYCGDR